MTLSGPSFMSSARRSPPCTYWFGARRNASFHIKSEAPPGWNRFPQRSGYRRSAPGVLSGRADRHNFYEPHGWYADGVPALPASGIPGGMECSYTADLAESSIEYCHVCSAGGYSSLLREQPSAGGIGRWQPEPARLWGSKCSSTCWAADKRMWMT